MLGLLLQRIHRAFFLKFYEDLISRMPLVDFFREGLFLAMTPSKKFREA